MIEMNVEMLRGRRMCRDSKVLKQIENGAMNLDINKHINTNIYNTRHKYVQQSAVPEPFYHSLFAKGCSPRLSKMFLGVCYSYFVPFYVAHRTR